VISPGAGSVDMEVVSIGVFKGHKLADPLSFWKWSQDVGDNGTGATHKAFEIAEPI
jgi:hypothetical protein